jgi:geranylgeranyl reductase family protein
LVKPVWDAIVIGAGPAGSAAARILAARGLRTLILEKDAFPRYKPCAGGLTIRAVELCSPGVQPALERRLDRTEIHYQDHSPIVSHYSMPILTTVQRPLFDMILLDEAIVTGAIAKCEHRVTAIKPIASGFEVQTPSRVFHCRFLVGCDGANGITQMLLRGYRARRFWPAYEAEISVSVNLMERFQDVLLIDLADPSKGYSWIFPKKEHLSVGCCGTIAEKLQLKACIGRFLDKHLGIGNYHEINAQAHPLPEYDPNFIVGSGSLLLCGDAGGFVDRFLGEGIYYAMQSGRCAGECIADHFDDVSNISRIYVREVRKKIGRNLLAASRLAWWIYHMPGVFFRLASKRPHVFQTFSNVLNQEGGYVRFIEELPAVFRMLFLNL